jgi:hypothetical protein
MLVVGCPSGVIQSVLSSHYYYYFFFLVNYFVIMLFVGCPSGVIQGVLSSHYYYYCYYYYCYVTRTLLVETQGFLKRKIREFESCCINFISVDSI